MDIYNVLNPSQNRVCQLLGIETPIIQGGLAYVGNGSLAAAVSEGGGFGQVGSAGRTLENFEREIIIARSKTKNPFGVNIPISAHTDFTPFFEILKRHRSDIRAVSFGGGNPAPYIKTIKDMGFITMVVISSPNQASKAERLGADIIICEGYEAGGHNGKAELTTFTLIPQVRRAVSVPVVAAGGISDEKGLIASIILGADGVQMGTRFVATTECEAHNHYKELIVNSGEDSTTVLIRDIKGPLRVYKNDYAVMVRNLEKNNADTEEILPFIKGVKNKNAAIDGDFENGYAALGQVSSLIDGIISATDVVLEIANKSKKILRPFHVGYGSLQN
ncbi:nitronate monooxygenase [Paenibacillus sp. BSR1-1]|uniref:NAD(P)H-dependent flavin oxidoreductase n=1 Tax=Paenibacillus sp. BSR1-1 TaxID=3020845 RepID=UPI0025B21291|nr:nitronate monooxygenase [Paenibacillus sp. BSR1-1]MDN3016166.1 nitronate monooxygenase [Paenibacillus sp. BSR1-1]